VAEIVDTEPWKDPGGFDCRQLNSLVKVLMPQRPTFGCLKDERSGVLRDVLLDVPAKHVA
jgi:hypothetical protein